MTLKEKFQIKIIRLLPFIVLILIGAANYESLRSYYCSDYIDLFDSSGNFVVRYYNTPITDWINFVILLLIISPLLYCSNRMNFCSYHKVPIIFIIFTFVLVQMNEIYTLTENFHLQYHLYNILILISFAISLYLYKRKNPDKR